MASTNLISADDSSSSKEVEQNASAAVQPQEQQAKVSDNKPTAVVMSATVASLEEQQQQPTTAVEESSSSGNGTDAVKRTSSTSTNNDIGGDGSADANKRIRLNDDEAKSDKKKEETEEVLDFAQTLGIVAGDRLQVKWEISNDDDNADDNEDSSTTTTHWWTATLLPHDGRVVAEEGVAIRTLDYDPYPEGGFPERSLEDVVFLGQDLLVDPVTRDELRFRRLGETHDIDDEDDEDAIFCIDSRDDLERVVNELLANALANQSAKWQSLSVAQQAQIASAVAEKKETLLTLLDQHRGSVVTGPVMQQLLAQAMQMPSSTSTL